ncbi:mannose-6-phosphate isomerase, class I [Glycomyces sp. NPDC048151]|uniref:mannose-6-phosphate isomerase, class I n=1 Tax=Glycomyces sp. NPDC048151 TaxID=3364002 RepID=UPI00371CE214
MLLPIDNDPRPYPWGAVGRIAALLGRPATGGPEAELWLGAHAGSPARVLDPAVGTDLREWIEREPERALGPHAAGRRLPFLLKVLAAGSPLSLQAHPDPERAAAGFARENAAGIPLDAPHRNYRDPFHKPELIVAVSDTFDALCGFRPVAETRDLAAALLALDAAGPDPDPEPLQAFAKQLDSGLSATVAWLLGGGAAPAVARIVGLAGRADRLPLAQAEALATVLDLDAAYPGDPGSAVSLLLNRVALRRGEALYLPAGNIHAYLEGVGVELMAASDNVLRGGLTGKHVDVPELLDVLDFRPLPVPRLDPERLAPGVDRFRPDVPDFALYRLDLDAGPAELRLPGPAIALSTNGSGRIGTDAFTLGTAWYRTPDPSPVTIAGTGELFVATTAHDLTPDTAKEQR